MMKNIKKNKINIINQVITSILLLMKSFLTFSFNLKKNMDFYQIVHKQQDSLIHEGKQRH